MGKGKRAEYCNKCHGQRAGKNGSLNLHEYSMDILGDLDKERDASDAYSLIANNTGVCIAFFCAFRALLEAVPFNPSTGLVDWNCVEPDHIRVAIVENVKHM